MRLPKRLALGLRPGLFVLLGGLALAISATAHAARSHHQAAIVSFERPTWVATRTLVGTYVIVHEDDDMALGKPCTRFYRIGTGTHPLEEAVAFYCIPRERNVVQSFTVKVDANPAGMIDTLTEYQFAGDSEGHGVPLVAPVSSPTQRQVPKVCAR